MASNGYTVLLFVGEYKMVGDGDEANHPWYTSSAVSVHWNLSVVSTAVCMTTLPHLRS